MTKNITIYTGFIIAFVVMAFTFLTAKTYAQLTIAIILYPLLAYFALRTFPRNNNSSGGNNSISNDQTKAVAVNTIAQVKPTAITPPAQEVQRAKVDVADIDKRTFIKLIGTAGISFFIFSILGQKVGSLLFGNEEKAELANTTTSNIGGNMMPNGSNYRISEIDDSGDVAYYGFAGPDGSWFIMRQDSISNSFRYSKGSSNFSGNWKNRINLKYSYYYELF